MWRHDAGWEALAELVKLRVATYLIPSPDRLCVAVGWHVPPDNEYRTWAKARFQSFVGIPSSTVGFMTGYVSSVGDEPNDFFGRRRIIFLRFEDGPSQAMGWLGTRSRTFTMITVKSKAGGRAESTSTWSTCESRDRRRGSAQKAGAEEAEVDFAESGGVGEWKWIRMFFNGGAVHDNVKCPS